MLEIPNTLWEAARELVVCETNVLDSSVLALHAEPRANRLAPQPAVALRPMLSVCGEEKVNKGLTLQS